jgi:Beige/BEACH domain/Neurobeachin beta propeller domain
MHTPALRRGGALDWLLGQSKSSHPTELWRQGRLSNFEYLMYLNTAAGRTYNDLNQYPVFPWVLSDYTSKQLDLSDMRVYRDLSRPVGALNPERLEQILARYQAFDDPDVPKFHYGSLYSSVGAVLYYLIRLEPFTTHFLRFQGGCFDHEARMFTSIAQSWHNCLHNSSDVKELTPEFFYLPEFLENRDRFRFGEHGHMDDVELPPWARGDAREFIRLHRLALESDYVSANLHHWVDLIFGYKSRGQAAVQAHNLFYFLNYPGAVDLALVEDPVQRRSLEAQIHNFGCCPRQLFRKPHPVRVYRQHTRTDAFTPLHAGLPAAHSSHAAAQRLEAECAPAVPLSTRVTSPPCLLRAVPSGDRLLTLFADGQLGVGRLLPPSTVELDAQLGTARQTILPALRYLGPRRHLTQGYDLDRSGRVLLSAGGWRDTLRLTQLSSQRTWHSAAVHRRPITCVAFASPASPPPDQPEGHPVRTQGGGRGGSSARTHLLAVSGSRDCTAAVWLCDLRQPASLTAKITRSTASTIARATTGLFSRALGGIGGGGAEAGEQSSSSSSSPTITSSSSSSAAAAAGSTASSSATAGPSGGSSVAGASTDHQASSGAAEGESGHLSVGLVRGRIRRRGRSSSSAARAAALAATTGVASGSLSSGPSGERGPFMLLHVLCGHDRALSAVAADAELDVVATGSLDQSVILHRLHKGRYLRTLRFAAAVSRLAISRSESSLLTHTDDGLLHVHSLNGDPLAQPLPIGQPAALLLTACGHYVLVGCTRDGPPLTLIRCRDLRPVRQLPVRVPVCALTMDASERIVVCAHPSGALSHVVIEIPDAYERSVTV